MTERPILLRVTVGAHHDHVLNVYRGPAYITASEPCGICGAEVITDLPEGVYQLVPMKEAK